jgi:hypothetical protein
MIAATRITHWHARAAQAAVAAIMLAALTACATTTPQPEPPPSAPQPPPPPPPPAPPPLDLGGKWKLSQASGGACVMTFGNAPGATQGTIAPTGGCPGNFFTSRKWTFEHELLIIRDYKGEPLAQLSFGDGRFEGPAANGGEVLLSR